MTEKNDEASAFFTAVQAAIDFGGPGYGNEPVLGFNTASQHVLVLLEDAPWPHSSEAPTAQVCFWR